MIELPILFIINNLWQDSELNISVKFSFCLYSRCTCFALATSYFMDETLYAAAFAGTDSGNSSGSKLRKHKRFMDAC